MRGRVGWIAAAALCAAAGASAQPASPDVGAPSAGPPPVELFAAEPDLLAAKLSPSGRYLALTTAGGAKRVRLVVVDLVGNTPGVVAASFGDGDVDEFHWVNDERLVFDVRDRLRGGGEQTFGGGLFSVARQGGALTRLVRTQWAQIRERVIGREPLEPNHVLLHVPQGGGREVIVGEYRWTGTGEPEGINAKRLNIENLATSNLSQGVPDNVWSWLFDPSGNPKLVTTLNKGRGTVAWREGDTWRTLIEHEAQKAPWRPRFVDSEGRLYVTVASGRGGATQLHRYDFAAGKPEREPLVSTPGFDFNGRIVSETVGGRALGVRVETDAVATVWFDPRLKALQAEADKRLPGRVNVLDCRRCDHPDMVVLIRSFSDQVPGDFIVHTAQDGQWRLFGSSRPQVDARRMATVDFESFAARDGRSIPVWVTRPAASTAPRNQPLPTVVLVHGGPWVRGGHWRWDADAQFLASRGYVVVEPEFRGSTGYGQEHFRAGWKQWGQAMQDDVADAVKWAATKGFTDPKRVCIAGASYGGYATLMGLVRHGELYRCGAAWVAATDLRLMFQWRFTSDSIEEWRSYSNPQLIGDPKADLAMLEANSPVLRAADINRPLLLVMGGADRRVPLEHGESMRAALERAGKAVEWKVYHDEGHGWNKFENRVDFYRRLERFLGEHLR
jgi:dipeptidyl aminopeptidase/acylaminoacyl peptidase